MTHLVVDGVMYLHSLSLLMAINATTGEPVWTHEMDPSGSGPVRGPTYADGRIYAYTGSSLYALDARTGDRLETFGEDGVLAVVGAALQFKYPDVFPPTLDPVTIGYCLTTRPLPIPTRRCMSPPRSRRGTFLVVLSLRSARARVRSSGSSIRCRRDRRTMGGRSRERHGGPALVPEVGSGRSRRSTLSSVWSMSMLATRHPTTTGRPGMG